MKYFIKNKKGVTLLEGLIALLLLALVATGTFGVLLATSRRSSQPNIREEMALAVERAMNKLQAYVYAADTAGLSNLSSNLDDIKNGLCGDDSDPLGSGTHSIPCMLPPICAAADRAEHQTQGANDTDSSFTYTVSAVSSSDSRVGKSKLLGNDIGSAQYISLKSPYDIQFNITCNGYKL